MIRGLGGLASKRKLSKNLEAGQAIVGPAMSPAPRDVWDALLRADPDALESQSPAWTDAACAAGPYTDASRLYETRDGRLLVLPMLRRRGGLGPLSFEASNPQGWGIGGVLGEGGATPTEVAVVFAQLSARRVVSQRLITNPVLAGSWAQGAPSSAIVTRRVAHVIDLEGGFEQLWKTKVQSSSRGGARRAEREGVIVDHDCGGRLIPEFYDLLFQAVGRWSRLQHEPLWLAQRRYVRREPRAKFEAIAAALGDRCHVYLARLDGRAIASRVVLRGANAYDFRAAMDEEYSKLRANDLLMRATLQDACEAGCATYFFGDSGRSASLAQFKERFGAQAYDYAEYRLERLPISAAERSFKRAVKKAIGFRDAGRVA